VGIGALLVALAIIGGIVLLVTGGGGDNGISPEVKQRLQSRVLKHTVVDVQKGISVRRPKDWTDSKRDHVITLLSHSRCLAMTLAAPDPASKANSVHDDAIELLKRTHGNAKTHPTPGGKQIGGIPTRSTTLSFKEKNTPITILLSVGKGDKYAYVTEVEANPGCQDDLRIGTIVLSSVEYTK
jgi:hypothetical protein